MGCRRTIFLFMCMAVCIAACNSQPSWEALQAEIGEAYPEVREVEPAVLVQWMAEATPPLLWDVRAEEEIQVSTLPGATAKPVDLPDDKAVRIVVYCSVGYRSAAAAGKLQGKGYTNVWNLAGSIFRWANEGRPLESSGQLTTAVHPYDEHWGRYLRTEGAR